MPIWKLTVDPESITVRPVGRSEPGEKAELVG